jgi:hypothetical protein
MGPHLDIRHQRPMADQPHFWFSGGAGGEIKNGDVVRAGLGVNLFERLWILGQDGPAQVAQGFERARILGFARQQNPLHGERRLARRFDQRLHGFRIFGEHGLGAASAQVADLIRQRIAGIESRGDGTVGHDAEVGQIELGAGFRMQGDDIAFADSQTPQAASDLPNSLVVLGPTVGFVFTLADRLMQSRRVAVRSGGVFED